MPNRDFLKIDITQERSNRQLGNISSQVAVGQWIRLRLPFWGLGFESQANHLASSFYSQILYYICHCLK